MVQIQQRDATKESDAYSKFYNTIYWDPNSASLNSNGVTTSPATGLAHEGAHANHNTESVEDSVAYKQRVDTSNETFQTGCEMVEICTNDCK